MFQIKKICSKLDLVPIIDLEKSVAVEPCAGAAVNRTEFAAAGLVRRRAAPISITDIVTPILRRRSYGQRSNDEVP